MKQGMKVQIVASAEQAYGMEGLPGVLPPNTDVFFTVEVVKHEVAEINKP